MRTSKRDRTVRLLFGIVVLLGVGAMVTASASAKLPVYDGVMSFPDIQGPSDPEEYSWEVTLGAGQELRLIDEQHAEVYYTEGNLTAFGIVAQAAHDAVGSTVPTSLEVSAGNVVTLVVHHRAGNPTAAGVPFTYPVVYGQGWEGGFHTKILVGPKDEAELREERERAAREEREAETSSVDGDKATVRCVVPRLKDWSLRAAKKRLAKAGCKIGEVRTLGDVESGSGKIVRQSPKPGVVRASGTAVRVTLG